ncbi:MAG: Ig-like domain-containing protein [Acidobacteriota bacterium]
MLTLWVLILGAGSVVAQPQPSASTIVVQLYEPVVAEVRSGEVVDVGELPSYGWQSELSFAVINRVGAGERSQGSAAAEAVSDFKVTDVRGPITFDLEAPTERVDLEPARGLMLEATVGSATRQGLAPLDEFRVDLSFMTDRGEFHFSIVGLAPKAAAADYSVSFEGFGPGAIDRLRFHQAELPTTRTYTAVLENRGAEDLTLPCGFGNSLRTSGTADGVDATSTLFPCNTAIAPGQRDRITIPVKFSRRLTAGFFDLEVVVRPNGLPTRVARLRLQIEVEEVNRLDVFFTDSSGRRVSNFGTEQLNSDELPRVLDYELVIRNLGVSSDLSIPCSGITYSEQSPRGVSGRLFERCPLNIRPGREESMDFELTLGGGTETGRFDGSVAVSPEGGGLRLGSLRGRIELEAACTADCPGPNIEIRDASGQTGGLFEIFHDGEPEIIAEFEIKNKGTEDLLLDSAAAIELTGDDRFSIDRVPNTLLIRPDPQLASTFAIKFDARGADPNAEFRAFVEVRSNAVNPREGKFELRVAEFDTPYVQIKVDGVELNSPTADLGTIQSLPRSVRFTLTEDPGPPSGPEISDFNARISRGQGLIWSWTSPRPPIGNESQYFTSLYEFEGALRADHTGADLNGSFRLEIDFYLDFPGLFIGNIPANARIAFGVEGVVEEVYNPSEDPDVSCTEPSFETECLPRYCQDLDTYFEGLTLPGAACLLAHYGAFLSCPSAALDLRAFKGCVVSILGAALCDVLLTDDVLEDLREIVDRFKACHCSNYGEICPANLPAVHAVVHHVAPGEHAILEASCFGDAPFSNMSERVTVSDNAFFPVLDCPTGFTVHVRLSDLTNTAGQTRSCDATESSDGTTLDATVSGRMGPGDFLAEFNCQCLDPEGCGQSFTLTGRAEGLEDGDTVGVGLYLPELDLATSTIVSGNGGFEFPEAMPAANLYEVRITNQGDYPHCFVTPTRSDILGDRPSLEVIRLECDSIAPNVRIVSPVEGAVVPRDSSGRVLVEVAAGDAVGLEAVDLVEFTDAGETLIGRQRTAPYRFSVGLEVGPHTVMARVTSDRGIVRESEPVSFSVETALGCADGDEEAPRIVLQQPVDGQRLVSDANGRVRLTAGVSDPSGVKNAKFFVDGRRVAVDASYPYSVFFEVGSDAAPSFHELFVRARDRCGNERDSEVIRFQVVGRDDACAEDSTPPEVRLIRPMEGATLVQNAGGRVTLRGQANDESGIEEVSFVVLGVELGRVDSPPYSLAFPLLEGTQRIILRATDRCANSAITPEVEFAVEAGEPVDCASDVVLPVVRLIEPFEGEIVTIRDGNRVRIRASAEDASGIDQVTFTVDQGSEQRVAIDDDAPYGYNWPINRPGVHRVVALASDRCGRASSTPPLRFIVPDDGSSPIVITHPSDGSDLLPEQEVPVVVAADDPDALELVELFVDGQMLADDPDDPFAWLWTPAWGDHTVQARAVTTLGNEHWSPMVSVSAGCGADQESPEVVVTQPAAGDSVVANEHGRFTLRAAASDDSTIDRVEFWVDGELKKTDSTAPYGYNWPAPLGGHTVQARAYDSCERNATSLAVSFTVEEAGSGECGAEAGPPTVAVTLPAAQSEVELSDTGRVLLRAAASDESGVGRVEFWVDGVHVWTDSTAPFAHHWLATLGPHLVKARAFDRCDEFAWSSEVRFVATEPGSCSTDSTSPEVVVTLPLVGQELEPSPTGRVLLRAEASDMAGIDRVEFWVDGSRVWTDFTHPFAHNWLATPGAHSVRAKAFDACDQERLSPAVTFTVAGGDSCSGDVLGPDSDVTLPLAGQTVEPSATGRVLLRAEASDVSGVDRVEFWVDGVAVWSDATAPYAHNWLSTPGPHSLQVKAFDACDNSELSPAVTFTVSDPDPCSGDDTAPTVSVTEPAAHQSLEPSPTGRILMRAAADDAGGIDRVEFWVDGAPVWTDVTAPYGHNWLATPGSHSVQAKAFDTCGNERLSVAVPITVTDPDPCSADGTQPTVAVTLPVANAVLEPSATGRVLFRADAGDAGGIDRVEFWVDGQVVWSDDTHPYAHNWLATAGAHSLRAKAFDACGNERLSAAVPFSVEVPDPCTDDNTQPQVSITVPLPDAVLEPSPTGRVLFRASASDAGGIDRVEFYVDGTLVRTDTDAPYAYNWLAASGSHVVRAKAFDACGNPRWSTEVPFSVP